MSNYITVDMPAKGSGDSLGEKGPYINIMEKQAYNGSDTQTVVPSPGTGAYGRRRTMPANGIAVDVGYDVEKDSVNALGKLYTKVVSFNVVTRNLIYILPFSLALAIPLIIFATVEPNARVGRVRLLGLFIWLQVMWWCLWLSKYFAQLLPLIYMKLSGFVSSGTRKYRSVIRALELPLTFMIWTVICWSTTPIITVFDKNPKTPFHWVAVFRRVLLAFIAVAALFLVEKLIIQLIAINYHRRQFEARVIESKVKVAQTDALYDASLAHFPLGSSAFRNEDFSIATGIDNSKTKSSNQKIIGNLAMFGENLQSTLGNITGELISSRAMEKKSAAIHNVVVEALESKVATEALAKRIWFALVPEGKEALVREDIHSIMGPDRHAQADEVFNLLDADENGDVTLEEMIMWVADVAHERKSIDRSRHDVGEAVKVVRSQLSRPTSILYTDSNTARSLPLCHRSDSFRHHLRRIF